MKCRLFLICLLLFPCVWVGIAVAQPLERVGTVNLGLVTVLHPKMSLFSFRSLGFYRVPLGLSAEDFQRAVEKLRTASNSADLENRLREAESRLAELFAQKQTLFSKPAGSENETDQFQKLMVELDEELQKARIAKENLRFSMENPELTSPTETKEIFSDIEREVQSVLDEVAKVKGIELILNSTLSVPTNFPVSTRTPPQFIEGITGIEQQVLQGLLKEQPPDVNPQPPDERFSRWIQLSQDPEIQTALPVRPWPLVLRGGESLTTEVIKKLYARYAIAPDLVEAACTAVREYESPEKSTQK